MEWVTSINLVALQVSLDGVFAADGRGASVLQSASQLGERPC